MPQEKHIALRKAPSLILSNINNNRIKTQDVSWLSGAKAIRRVESEIVPDSEGERVQRSRVIEISSDEDEEYDADDKLSGRQASVSTAVTVAVPKSSRSSKSVRISTKFGPSRRVIESSDSEEDANDHNTAFSEIIELTDDSDDELAPANLSHRSPSKPLSRPNAGIRRPNPALYVDSENSDVSPPTPLQDTAILVLNDPPRSQCKPILLVEKRGESSSSTPKRITGTVSVRVDVTPVLTTSVSPSKKQSRRGVKAEAEAKLERLKTYAKARFDDLNSKVFENKIPATTKIEWNNRLRSTAGKASYQRDRQGMVHSKIELAIKVLDAEERIDRTLSHEMCHLGSWIINGKLDEQHGQVFKTWASRVERIFPDIVVSTTHDYEISHPWNWKCDFCSYTYGRFSKSIKADVAVCGVCKKGRLIPLFEQPVRRAPATPRVSRMATSKPQPSPTTNRSQSPVKHFNFEGREITCIHDSDSVSEPELEAPVQFDVEQLATKMASTNISA